MKLAYGLAARGRRRRLLGVVAAALLGVFVASPPLGGVAQESTQSGGALQELFEKAREGDADQHLPFVIVRLKRALANQDLLGLLDLVDPVYFDSQFALLSQSGRAPGEIMSQFACEFFTICDISKKYSFNDIVSAQLVSVSPDGGLTEGLVELELELRMWDGQTVFSKIFYDPSSAKFSAAVG